MRASLALLVSAVFSGFAPSEASDACSTVAISADATVQVSDGSSFDVQTRFHAIDEILFRAERDDSETTILVEGPTIWIRSGDEAATLIDTHKHFVLGHQFHAILLRFDDIVSGAKYSDQIEFLGRSRSATSGDLPYGGRAHLIHSDTMDRPSGLILEPPGAGREHYSYRSAPVTVTFADWRQSDAAWLPFRLMIDDGERTFTYTYTRIDVQDRSPHWFEDVAGSVELDSVNLYRLHRQMLAAHCAGDASAIVSRATNPVWIAGNGRLEEVSREDFKDQFSGLFSRLDYKEYHDIKPPLIEVSKDGDLAWVGVEVVARGHVIASGEPFESQWSWIMTARKIDGSWYLQGNASNTSG